jgi:uncharacterized membrane protein
MNFAHWHLLLNHLPVLGTAFGTLVLLTALLKRNDELKRLSLWIFVLAALAAVSAYLTGEPTEGVIERLPNVAGNLIERHEDWALISLVATGLTGALALVGWFAYRKAERLPQWLSAGALALALVTSGLMAWTANLGGQIRHPEIVAANAAQLNETGQPSVNSKAEHKDDKDDDD